MVCDPHMTAPSSCTASPTKTTERLLPLACKYLKLAVYFRVHTQTKVNPTLITCSASYFFSFLLV